MKRESFYAKGNRSDNLLHIETDGCIVNIRVGLTDDLGRQMTRVDVLPDDMTRGGRWVGHHGDFGINSGWQVDCVPNRVVLRDPGSAVAEDLAYGEPASGISATPHKAMAHGRICGTFNSLTSDGLAIIDQGDDTFVVDAATLMREASR